MISVGTTLILCPLLLAVISPYVISGRITYLSHTAALDPEYSSNSSAEARKTGDLVANLNNASNQNPEELGSYFEGDIRIPSQSNPRLAFLANRYRWPNGVVPYTINGQFSDEEQKTIKWAMDEFRKQTCINFKPRSGEKDYVSIVSGRSGCWAAVGRNGGRQEVNLQTPACLWKRGVVLHELMHAVGFLHEHTRHDRDSFVTINMQNIDKSNQHNFQKHQKNEADGLGLRYDYASVMHYSAKSFSNNGKETITVKKDTDEAKRIGQRDGFSKLDVEKLKKLYKCSK